MLILESTMTIVTIYNILDIKQDYYGSDKQVISLAGKFQHLKLDDIAKEIVPALSQITTKLPMWPSGAYGIVILILTYLIFEKAYEERQ